MNSPNPAIVSQRAVGRLPRLALLLLCAAYLLPGLFARDPWKNADIAAFGAMVNMARGTADWLHPTVAGVQADIAPLPYWLGAAAIRLLGPWVDAPLAARVPFALLLAAVLALTWYACLHLARTEAAQPLPFAFGGEAHPIDYARAIADGALLALIATLGLLQLGHETTPELAQLATFCWVLYGLASAPWRPRASALSVAIALPALAASGAPVVAVLLAAVGVAICLRSHYEPARRLVRWLAVGGVLSAAVATALGAWAWRLAPLPGVADAGAWLRLGGWFLWPCWPLALLTLWRWRRHWTHRHILVPAATALVPVVVSAAMGGSDRALMLATPAVAVLAAFALPTLQRSVSAAIDWFSVCFFTASVLLVWVTYAAMQTGLPAATARNIAKLAPGYESRFSLFALLVAALGSAAWVWLVVWRTGRHRHPLWKSMVLPASGVAVSWLLAMSLWLPILDYARSLRPLVDRVALFVPRDACVAAPGVSRANLAALEYFGRYRIDGMTPLADTHCEFLLQSESLRSPRPIPEGWLLLSRELRPTDRDEVLAVLRRDGAPPPAASPGDDPETR